MFHFEFILNMPRLSKDQRVWVCLEHTRIQNAAEVKRRWPGRWGNIPPPTKRTISTIKINVLEDTRFRTNKSCLYFVNNNTSFHNKKFVKCDLFTANSAYFS